MAKQNERREVPEQEQLPAQAGSDIGTADIAAPDGEISVDSIASGPAATTVGGSSGAVAASGGTPRTSGTVGTTGPSGPAETSGAAAGFGTTAPGTGNIGSGGNQQPHASTVPDGSLKPDEPTHGETDR